MPCAYVRTQNTQAAILIITHDHDMVLSKIVFTNILRIWKNEQDFQFGDKIDPFSVCKILKNQFSPQLFAVEYNRLARSATLMA